MLAMGRERTFSILDKTSGSPELDKWLDATPTRAARPKRPIAGRVFRCFCPIRPKLAEEPVPKPDSGKLFAPSPKTADQNKLMISIAARAP